MELKTFFQSEEKSFEDKYGKVLPYPFDTITKKDMDDPEMYLGHVQAFWSEFYRNNLYLKWSYGTNAYDYTTLRLYADGNQPNQKYKDQLTHADPEKKDGTRIMYEGISWDNESVLPRFKESVMQLLMEMDVFYAPAAVDDASIQMRERVKNAIWERSRNDFYQKAAEMMGQKYDPQIPFVPANMMELDLFAQTALEITHEIKMKKVMDSVMDTNDWDDELKLKIYEDLYTIALAAVRTYMTSQGYEAIEYVDPQYLLFPKSNRHDYNDINRAGHVKWMDIQQIRRQHKKNGHYTTEKAFFDKIKELILNRKQEFYVAEGFQSFDLWQMNQNDSQGSFPYDQLKLPVLVYEFEVQIQDKFTDKADGRTYFEPASAKEKNTDKNKTYAKTYSNWLTCEWVIGTDLMITWGPKEYLTRDSEGRCKSSYTIYRVGNKSLVAAQIPIEDRLEIITKKFQLAWKRAAPAGYKVNYKNLENMSLKMGGAKLHPFEVLDIYMDTGILLENVTAESIAGPRGGSAARTFEIIPGGMGPMLNEYMTTFQNEMAKLSIITGITETLLGASPQPGQLNGVTQLSIQGSMNRIRPLFNGYKKIKKEVSKKIMVDILNYARFNPEGFSATYKNFNDNTMQKIVLGAKEAGYRFGLKIEQVFTEETKQLIINSAQTAVAKGTLTEIDFITITEQLMKGNLKFAKVLMEYKMSKNMQMQSQINQQNAEMNAQVQQQSLQAKGDMDIRKIQEEGNQERQNIILEANLEAANPTS